MTKLFRSLTIFCAVLLGSIPSFVFASEIGGSVSPPTLGTTVLPFGATTSTVSGLTLTNVPGINGLTPANYLAAIVGTGADGTVTISSGTTSVSREMHYANLTVNGTGHLNLQVGWPIRVSNTLDLTSCPAGGIFVQINGAAVYNPTAGAASGATAGVGGDQFADRSDAPGSDPAVSGKAGGTGVGTAGAQGSAQQNFSLGGRGGAAGAGGASGTPNAGGALAAQRGSTAFVTNPSTTAINTNFAWFLNANTPSSIGTSQSGAQGGAGGGDGVNSGGGSGASGAGGGPLRIYANTINRGGSTAVSCVAALGENAGASANGVAGTAGGGGGSGGGGGGWIHLVVGTLTGTTATNAIDASGGNGAAGGNGLSTGKGGNGGDGGNCGTIDIINLSAGTYTHPITGDGAGSAGGTTANATGGTAGTGCNGQANL